MLDFGLSRELPRYMSSSISAISTVWDT